MTVSIPSWKPVRTWRIMLVCEDGNNQILTIRRVMLALGVASRGSTRRSGLFLTNPSLQQFLWALIT